MIGWEPSPAQIEAWGRWNQGAIAIGKFTLAQGTPVVVGEGLVALNLGRVVSDNSEEVTP